MKPQYQIVFAEQNKTGASQMSATILASLIPSDVAVNFAILGDQLIGLTSQSTSALMAQHYANSYRSLRETKLNQLLPIDLMIGLVLASDHQDFVKQLQSTGIEKHIGVSVYWDLTHLAMDDPSVFAQLLYKELQARIRLLVEARF